VSDETITCRYVFTGPEYGRAMRCYWKHAKSKWALAAIVLICGGLTLYGALFPDESQPPPPPATGSSIFFALLPALCFVIFIAVLVLFAGQFYFRRTAYFNKEMTYTLWDGGVHIKSPLTETEMKWPIYAKATESPSGFALFHQGKRMFNWLPKSGFTDPGSIDRCRELLRQKVKDSKRLAAS
jgi:YcxB-like protein